MSNELTMAVSQTPDSTGSFPDIHAVLEIIQLGGPVVAVLILMSVFATAVVLAKIWQFQRCGMGNLGRGRGLLELYRAGRTHDALMRAQACVDPVCRMLTLGMTALNRGLPAERVRDDLFTFAADQLAQLRGWLRPLEVIAALAPLLGLFGTVLGMISAFQQLEMAGAQVNPAILSGGIWEALLTTAMGLGVAIPAVIALNYLERRVERLAHEMEYVGNRLFAVVPMDIDQHKHNEPAAEQHFPVSA